jgi:Ran GTPase-activating protein (RanGAP) involved in mRNA processing and transport
MSVFGLQMDWTVYTEVRSLKISCDFHLGLPQREPKGAVLAALFRDQSRAFHQLQALDVFGNRMGDEGVCQVLDALCESGTDGSLRSLNLSWNDLSESTVFHLAGLLARGHLPRLKCLHVSNNRLGDLGAAAIFEGFSARKGPREGLEVVDLSDNRLGPGDLAHLGRALRTGAGASLRLLSLCCNGITDRGAAALAGALGSGGLESLRHLDLESNKIGTSGARALGGVFRSGSLPLLCSLSLRNNCIADEGAQALAYALQDARCASLSVLDLSGNSIASGGAVAVAQAVASGRCRLRTLSMAWNNLADEGAAAFAENVAVGGRPSLERLDMGNNSIGDAGLKALARALYCAPPLARLHSVDLTGNDFHDGGVRVLASFQEAATKSGLTKVMVYNGIMLDNIIKPRVGSLVHKAPAGKPVDASDLTGLSIEDGPGPVGALFRTAALTRQLVLRLVTSTFGRAEARPAVVQSPQ